MPTSFVVVLSFHISFPQNFDLTERVARGDYSLGCLRREVGSESSKSLLTCRSGEIAWSSSKVLGWERTEHLRFPWPHSRHRSRGIWRVEKGWISAWNSVVSALRSKKYGQSTEQFSWRLEVHGRRIEVAYIHVRKYKSRFKGWCSTLLAVLFLDDRRYQRLEQFDVSSISTGMAFANWDLEPCKLLSSAGFHVEADRHAASRVSDICSAS